VALQTVVATPKTRASTSASPNTVAAGLPTQIILEKISFATFTAPSRAA
jgi:hypothetical protein